MWVLDEWAERHILDARRRGEFTNLPGQGKPLELADESHIPADLRAGYRLLKNAGYLPPELEQRREALELVHLLNSMHTEHPEYAATRKQVTLLELKLRQAGLETRFLYGDYAQRIMDKL